MRLDLPFMMRAFLLALGAVPVTLKITLTALIIAAPFGFVMALCNIYRVRILKELSNLYISFIRGTPIVLQILILYSLLPSLLNGLFKKAGWAVNIFDLDPIIYAYAVFALNNAALLAELFRSALLAVDKGQYEAALSAGLSPARSYLRIVLPQALVTALPNLCNLTITLIKNTSLAFIMTVKDITAVAKIEASYAYNYVEAYLDIFVLYIIICGVTQFLFDKAESRFRAWKPKTAV
ncbi:MAG: amino acid ABC transporter permease [Treponema sp.]|jgi:L-cystine transport system permease protein|nr:amino acid ABC transporter permease [Treponema sp.]